MHEVKKIFSNGAIIFIGTLTASILSYIFNMIMGRMLGPDKYGEMTAIMSLLMVTSVGGGSILIIAMRYSGELYHSSPIGRLKSFFMLFTKYILYISIAFFVLGLTLTKPIALFLNLHEILPIVMAFATFIFGFLILVNKGFLQGTQKFLPLSLINTLEMVLRVLIGVILVRIGLGLNGAIFAIVAAIFVSYIFTFWPLKKLFKEVKIKISGTEEKEVNFNRKEILSYSWPTALTTLFLIVALNIDIVFVKHFFDSQQAGVYAAISTIAKIILYGTAPITSVMFPMISERKVKGDKHYIIFLLSLLVTVVAAALIVGVYVVMPGKVILLLYGQRYLSLYPLLPEVGLFVFFYTLVNLLANYFLAIKSFTFIWFFAAILILQVAAISLWHPSIMMIVRTLIATTGLLFALMLTYYLVTKKAQILAIIKGDYGKESRAVNSYSGV